MAEILPEIETFAKIVVVGVGGGGCNAVNRMMQSNKPINGVEFVVVNTDAQALHNSPATKVHIGKDVTRGLGAGANPDLGRKAAEESLEDVLKVVRRADMVFLTGGLGGGTGSGALPVIARAIKEQGTLTVAIVTKPFLFEGTRRMRVAEEAIANLKDGVDTLIVIPNERIIQKVDIKSPVLEAFAAVDEVLRQGIQGISDLITVEGLINLDFADVQSVMKEAGTALMGIGMASGENRAVLAARQAMDSPLLDVSIQGAKGVLINFTGGRDLGMHEINEASNVIRDAVDPEANIIFGAVIDENLTGEIRISLVATGFDVQYPNRTATNPFIGSHNYQPPSNVSNRSNPFDLSSPNLSNENDTSVAISEEFRALKSQPLSTSDMISKLGEDEDSIVGFTAKTTEIDIDFNHDEEDVQEVEDFEDIDMVNSNDSEIGINFDDKGDISDDDLAVFDIDTVEQEEKAQTLKNDYHDTSNQQISSIQIDEDELEQPAFLRRK